MTSMYRGLAEWLGQNIDGLTFSEEAGGNIFIDRLPSDPDQMVALVGTGGFEADSALPYSYPTVQIITRSTNDPRWSLDTWEAIYSKLQGLRNVELPDGTWLVYAIIVQSGPFWLGPDDSGRQTHSMNVRTEIYNPTEERP